MSPSDIRSRTPKVRFLEEVVQEVGPLFTREEIWPLAARRGWSRQHLSKVLSALKASGSLEVLKRGIYLVKSPLFAGEIHPFAIAATLVRPSAISHWSALAHHGFTTQIPSMIQASTPRKVVTPEMRQGRSQRPRGRAVWQAADLEIEYISVAPRRFFGHQDVWVDRWHRVAVTDAERTALDLIARPDIFGGIPAAIEILEEILPALNLNRLITYTLKYGEGATIKRMGWVLEHLGVSMEALGPLKAYPVSNYYRLDPQSSSKGRPNSTWHIRENLQGGSHVRD